MEDTKQVRGMLARLRQASGKSQAQVAEGWLPVAPAGFHVLSPAI
jgi:hypothetical protein